MAKTITLNTFRRFEAAQESMMRAMMPRTSEASPEPLTSDIRTAESRRTWSAGSLIVKTGFTLAEVTGRA
jgi:hypothetical protein